MENRRKISNFALIFKVKKENRSKMLRIAVQSKGRLYEDTMNLLGEADIKISKSRRTLLVQSENFPLEVLYLRDDDIPQSVATGLADIGIVGENEFVERGEDASAVCRWPYPRRPPMMGLLGSTARR